MITVRPMDQERRNKWLELFNTDRLPVLHAHPRKVERLEGTVLAYDLDVNKLTSSQLDRLAAHIARRENRRYHMVREEVSEGWTLPAHGLIVTVGEPSITSRRQSWKHRRPWNLIGRVFIHAKRSA